MRSRRWAIAVSCSFAFVAASAYGRPVEDASAFPSFETVTIGDAQFELRRVPKGTFRAGSPADSRWHAKDEIERDVTLTKDFEMLDAPVTRGQYAAFVADTAYVTEMERNVNLIHWKNPGFPQTDEHPVVWLNHADALAFVSWFSAKTGRTARLPTDAEYEYATRAGTTTAWYVGDDETAARTIGVFESKGTGPVKQHVPNAWGLFDLSGNVYEWCADYYGYYEPTAVTDPRNEPPLGNNRVLRGGSWKSAPKDGRSAARRSSYPSYATAETGFRFVVVAGNPVPAASLNVPPLGSVKPLAPREPEPAPADESSWGSNLAILAGIASIPILFFLLRPKRPKS